MRKILSILIPLFLILTGCKTPEKLYESGDYDGAIRLVESRMRKPVIQEDDIKTLVKAFNHINGVEADKLTSLRTEQRTDERWAEIFKLANRIRERQDLLKPYLPNDEKKYFGLLQDLHFTNIDYAISESREGAADYYYKRGVENIEKARKGDRKLARNAYEDFVKVNDYFASYKETASLKSEAYDLGINHAYFRVENESRTILPSDFETQVKSVFVRDLNTKWVKYHTFKDPKLRYEYDIVNRLTRIEISPERNDNNRWTEEAEIEDGFDVQKDAEGNIKRDTLGNEIKTKRFIKVKAEVFEVQQFKEARVFGYLEYYDNRTNEKVLNQPIEVTGVFQNTAVRFEGDKRALKKETQRRLGGEPRPYPSDADLLLRVTENMKKRTKAIMDENGYILEK